MKHIAFNFASSLLNVYDDTYCVMYCDLIVAALILDADPLMLKDKILYMYIY